MHLKIYIIYNLLISFNIVYIKIYAYKINIYLILKEKGNNYKK